MAVERILVVDDEEDLLELVRYNLSKEGYQVRAWRPARRPFKRPRLPCRT